MAVKVKLPALPATKLALAALVKAGGPPMLMVKAMVVAPALLVAWRVTG